MVMIIPEPREHKPLFRWLTRCDCATKQPCASPPHLSKWQRRWLAGTFGASQLLAIALGFGVSSLKPPIPTEAPFISEEQRLWNSLGSSKLAQARLSGTLARAERERLQAQQLRIDAEEKAQSLMAKAKSKAEQTTTEALFQSDMIRLDASYIGAEQVIYAPSGDAVTLKFAARIECKEREFGQTATAYPLDSRIAVREVRNLGKCFASRQTAAGSAIGEVGDFGIAFFKLSE